jgi:hypothetical protein
MEWREYRGDAARWNSVAAAHGTAFHRMDWLRMLATEHRCTLWALALMSGEDVHGIAPLFVRRYGPLLIAGSPLVVEETPYLGIACPTEHLPTALPALLHSSWQRGAHFVRLMQRERVPDLALPGSVVVLEKHTHRLDLQVSEAELLRGMEGRCRTAIRKAEKSGVTVHEETGDGWIGEFHEMLSGIYHAQRLAVPNEERFFKSAWAALVDGQRHAFLARVGGTMVAGAIIVRDGDRAYYLTGASKAAFNSLSPNNLVQWSAIQRMRALGVTSYDFVGSDIERLARFKRSFGGVLSTHACIEAARTPIIHLVRREYPRLKVFLSRLRQRLQRARLIATTSMREGAPGS